MRYFRALQRIQRHYCHILTRKYLIVIFSCIKSSFLFHSHPLALNVECQLHFQIFINMASIIMPIRLIVFLLEFWDHFGSLPKVSVMFL